MAATDLRLQVILQTLDRATAPLRRIKSASSETARALNQARDKAKELDVQQKAIGEFRTLQKGLKETAVKLAAVRARLGELRTAHAADAQAAKAHAQELKAGEAIAKRLAAAQESQLAKLGPLRTRLAALGIKKVADDEARLAREIAATNTQIDAQKAKLKQLAERDRAMQAASATHQRRNDSARRIGFGGAIASGMGIGLMHKLRSPIEESKGFAVETQRVAALGMGEQVSKDAVAFAKGMKTYGTSTQENLALVRDGLTVFADLHHAQMVAPTLAKMKFANEAIYGSEQGGDNEKKFMDMLKVIELRGGLASEAAFKDQANKIQRVIVSTGGRVQSEEWLNLIKTGGVAAKGLTDEALYYQMEPLVQEMGGHRVGTSMMSAYSNIYQGKTTKRSAMMLDQLGLIADPSKVKHDKVGQVAQLGVGALKGSELFRENQFEWMEQILLPQLAAKGITEKQQVLDAMGGIFSNRTASNLFAQMYLQRDQIRKNAALNAGADGIDQLYGKARETGAGAELDLAAKRANIFKQIGDSIMPAYVKALEVVAGALKWLTEWMEENPRAAQIMATGLGAIAVGLAVLGGIALTLAPLLMGMAFMSFLMAKAGLQGKVLSGAMRALLGVVRLAGGALQLLVRVLLLIGRALLMNPIGIAITAIALLAFAIYKNWGPIKKFCKNMWDKTKGVFNDAIEWLSGLPERFREFGSNMIDGLVEGIKSKYAAVKGAITEAGGVAIDWFKEKLGIQSPSRVFMLAGQDIVEGAAIGIAGREHRMRRAALGMAAAATSALPLMAGAQDGTALIDRRPPIAASAAPQGISIGGDTIHITVQAGPEMDAKALARAIGAELDRRQRNKLAAMRSSLADIG